MLCPLMSTTAKDASKQLIAHHARELPANCIKKTCARSGLWERTDSKELVVVIESRSTVSVSVYVSMYMEYICRSSCFTQRYAIHGKLHCTAGQAVGTEADMDFNCASGSCNQNCTNDPSSHSFQKIKSTASISCYDEGKFEYEVSSKYFYPFRSY